MKKVVFGLSNLFTLKRYKDNNLNCQSYEYPTIYSIRCAILGAVIQVDGLDKARELFNKIKNTNIFIQFPREYKVNGIRLKRYGNSYYKKYDELDREKMLKNNWNTTMGFREYVQLDKIVFYIDDIVPDIDLYLKNIDWIGTAESMVYLEKIEEVSYLENVLVKWNGKDSTKVYEQHDWGSKTTFESVYMYSERYSHIHRSFMCQIDDIKIG